MASIRDIIVIVSLIRKQSVRPVIVQEEAITVECGKLLLNTLRQNGRHFADDIFKCIFLNENVWIPIKISLKFVPKGPINNIPALVQIMVWRCPGAKPLSEPMMVSLPTHICVTWPQWVKGEQLPTKFTGTVMSHAHTHMISNHRQRKPLATWLFVEQLRVTPKKASKVLVVCFTGPLWENPPGAPFKLLIHF